MSLYILKYRHSLVVRVAKTLFPLVYSGFLLYAVFFARRRRHLTTRYLNLVPLKKVLLDYRYMADMGAFNYYTNLFGNVMLFIPIPFLLGIYFKMTRFLTVLCTGFLISLSIETLQYIFDVGVADVDDVILNTLGTCAGFFCYRAFRNFFNHTTPAST